MGEAPIIEDEDDDRAWWVPTDMLPEGWETDGVAANGLDEPALFPVPIGLP